MLAKDMFTSYLSTLDEILMHGLVNHDDKISVFGLEPLHEEFYSRIDFVIPGVDLLERLKATFSDARVILVACIEAFGELDFSESIVAESDSQETPVVKVFLF